MIVRTIALFMGLAGAALVITLAPGCSEEDIVLATLPHKMDGGMRGAPTRCIDETECAPDEFCSRAQCTDVGGICELRGTLCESEPLPVCGCDGITYWNDCLRRNVGITAMTPGECMMEARHCSVEAKAGSSSGPDMPMIDPCPAGASCALLLPPDDMHQDCPPDVHGSCWALPAVCPKDQGPDRWISCGPIDGCVTTCDAIRKGMPHRRARSCP